MAGFVPSAATEPGASDRTPGSAASLNAFAPPAGDALDPIVQPQCSLAVQLRRANGAVIGRGGELDAIGQEIREATGRLAAVTLEGEPGIGKTRLLLAAGDVAARQGFTCVAVTADEEIRGPFLLARSLFASSAVVEAAAGTPAEGAVRRAVDAVSGRDEPGFENLTRDGKTLRAFDLGAVAIAALASVRPLALLIDDVQWADDDTLRLLRYAVRTDADRPIFLLLTIRPDEMAVVTEGVNLIADMERMGLVRRLRPGRFAPVETAELLTRVLGGPVDGASAAAMHAQSEGVPFIVEEIARAHRDAGTLQELDGKWRLGRNAARLLPSAVRTLISRRSARLPKRTQALLGEAAVLGRSFSLRDLRAIEARTPDDATAVDPEAPPGSLADELRPAVEAGLLLPHAAGEPADFTFTHEQVRQFAVGQLSAVRRRAIHAAVVDLLLDGGEPAPEGLPMLAQHALAAGDTGRAARFSIDAAAAALGSNAPEEALRLVEAALPVISTPADRRTLLATRDDAYAALRRTDDRLEGLTELAALAEALRDPAMELDVQLRRSSALRMEHDEAGAADLARRVRARAADRGDRALELRATLEQGQALLQSAIGESFGSASSEVDIPGGEEAYRHAVELAEALGDDRSLAAALRELAMIDLTKARDWFAGEVKSGRALELSGRIAAGEDLHDILPSLPIAPLIGEATQLLERALAIYERLGDRTGEMSTVIGMAYVSYAPVIHLTSSARHLEEIRRVRSRLTEMVTESERAREELQMLYGVHVYARAKVVPDLAIQRGEEAYRAARVQANRSIEFAAAGGVALSYLELGDVEAAEKWLGSAANAAAAAPSRARARQLESWRGRIRGAAGDAEGMRRHLERAVAMATEDRRPAARCEALARLAVEAARLGGSATPPDDALLDLAESSAGQAKELVRLLAGRPPWGAFADAALAQVRLARGDLPAAAEAGGAVVQYFRDAAREDAFLQIVLPAARAILAGAPPEVTGFVRGFLRLLLSRIAQGTVDESIRVRWLRGPLGRELVELAGPMDAPSPDAASAASRDAADGHAAGGARLDVVERRLLQLLTEGHTNREMAEALGLGEDEVGRRLARLLAQLGASSRAEATSLAFRGLAPVGTH